MNLDAALELLARDPAAPVDIAEVALLLARDEFSDLDVAGYLSEIDAMAREVSLHLSGNLQNQLSRLCRYLFHEMGFHGNQQDYYDPNNSYLHMVLDRRKGIPISLSAVVMAVGNRAGIEIQGVGLPGHFIVKAMAGSEEIPFDPFHGGRRLELEDCARLVLRATGLPCPASPQLLRSLPAGLIVTRMLNNLKGIYLGKEDYRRAARTIGRLQQLQPENPAHHRDKGECYLKLGQAGKAVDSLSAYLECKPDDGQQVSQMLQAAKKMLAQWN